MNRLISFALISIVFSAATLAQVITRGPYLNSGTTTSMVVRWRADTVSDSKLWYGTTMDTAAMTKMVDTSSVTDHEMNVSGLVANTKYFYAVGSTSAMLAGADSGHYFQTSPITGSNQLIRILAMGDLGTGSTKQTAVKDAYLQYTNNAHTDVWMWLGDNAYNDGRDADFDVNTFPMYPEIFPRTVLWPALGNHDYGSQHPILPDGPGPYLNMFTLPTAGEAGGTPSGDEGYYSYDYGNVHFVCLNSENYSWSGFPPNITITHDPAMVTWLENDLTNNTNTDWVIAYFHATPYADGTHSEAYSGSDPIKIIDGIIMRTMRDELLPILEAHGVDMVLAGHSHDYERSVFTYGNYGSGAIYPPDSTVLDAGTGRVSDGTPYRKYTTGPNANKGGVFCVVGSSAKTGDFADDGPLNHSLMKFDDYRLGSMLIEIDSNQLNAFFIDTSGVAWDNFTIIKTPMPAYVAPTVVRGPYLNLGTATSMVVRWRTDTLSDSKIWYGTSLDTSLMLSMISTSLDSNHEMNITGLSADTKYFYAIGNTVELLAGADNGHYFRTSPVIGTKQPVRIWAIGDFGEGNSNQAAVRDAFKAYSGDGHADVWVWLGDNAYDYGLDSEYQTNAFDMYPAIFANTVLWPSPGNHDYGINHPGTPGEKPDAYLDMFTLPTAGEAGGTASGSELYYSYDYGNVHFISISSEEYVAQITLPDSVVITNDSTMLAWLESDLTNNTNTDWIVAYLHAAPYADGTHSENYSGTNLLKLIDGIVMRSMRDNVIPILENHGVDLVLAGHSHDYERSYFTYGNYGSESPYTPDSTILDAGTGRLSDGAPYQKMTTGPNANKGAVFCVVGCSAKIGDFVDDGPLNHELMVFDDYRLGSLMIDIADDTLKAYFIDTSGTAWDDFAIVKTFASSVPDLENKKGSLKVYPNPFADQLTIEYTLDLEEGVSLTLLDLTGQQVYTIVDSKQAAGNYKYTIDTENTGLSKGVYLLQLKTEGSLVVQKTIRL
ncbi:MAG: metallophosphoesterase [Flavobacteriales bacterium]|nr:metallophosphoesterase [Flavobacteriales bacterium]